jgi:hypothetical protein
LMMSGLVFTNFSASDFGKCLSLSPHATMVGTFQLHNIDTCVPSDITQSLTFWKSRGTSCSV